MDKLDLILAELQKINNRLDNIESHLNISTDLSIRNFNVKNLSQDERDAIIMYAKVKDRIDKNNIFRDTELYSRAKRMNIPDQIFSRLYRDGADINAYLNMLEKDA